MTRPLRIEYEDAFYHVMNRGRGRQRIFYSDKYYQAFLACLAEAHVRFGLQVNDEETLCFYQLKNTPRRMAMKLCQDLGGVTLSEIAKEFHAGNYSTLSQTIGRLNMELTDNKLLLRYFTMLS